MRIQVCTVGQLQGRTAGTVAETWGRVEGAPGRDSRAGQPGGDRVGVGSTVRAVQETQGSVISGRKTKAKREHSDLPPPSARVAYGSVLRGVFPGRKRRRRRKMFGLLGSLSFPMVQGRSW